MPQNRIYIFDFDNLPLKSRLYFEKNEYIINKVRNENAINIALRTNKYMTRSLKYNSRFIFSPQLNRPVPITEFTESQYFIEYQCIQCDSEINCDMREIRIDTILCDNCKTTIVETSAIQKELHTFIEYCREKLNESYIMIMNLILKQKH